MKNNAIAKLVVVIAVGLMMITGFTACNKEDNVDYKSFYDTVVNMPPGAIRASYLGSDIPFSGKAESFQDVYTSGTVISDATAGNVPEGYLVIQGKEGGLALQLDDAATAKSYKPGDLIKIKINNATLTSQNGNVVLKGISDADIQLQSTGNTVKPTDLTLTALSDNFDTYNESLVRVNIVSISPAPSAGTTYEGSLGLTDGTTDPGVISLYTSPSSTLAKEVVSDTASYVGIAMFGAVQKTDSLAKQIWIQNASDISRIKLTAMNTDIVLTGFLANPAGSDAPVPGTTSSGVTHKGGYEYMQFMALKDIDFSQTPYSVVAANDRQVKPDGWAAGGLETFKFNLTQGKVKAGDFFYVGGSSKVIAGYSSKGLSTDISGANWIRAISINSDDPNKITGDGFGQASAGFLGNGSAADGIAIFKGTDVSKNSIPVDMLFYDGAIFVNSGSMAYNAATGDGFQSANNEFYQREHNGVDQFLFGQGTNTYVYDPSGNGSGSTPTNVFVKLGGILSANGWLVSRSPSTIELTSGSPLTAIESGAGVTVYHN